MARSAHSMRKRKHSSHVPRMTAGAAAAAVTAAGAAVYERRVRRRRRAERRRFRLSAHEPAPAELHRVLDARFDTAIAELERLGHDPVRAVHEGRKAIKRLRAVLRLARGALGDNAYRRENASLRDAGRRLAPLRDAMAMSDVLEALAAQSHSEIEEGELERVRKRLRDRSDNVHVLLDSPTGAVADVLVSLRAARVRLRDEPLAADGLRPLLKGLRGVYRRGRACYRSAREDPSTENLHAWRKRAKDLRYGAELLREADPKRLRPIRREARTLSELLGHDHDLAVLAESAGDCQSILTAIAGRRSRLHREALTLGKQLYAASPRRFARRAQRRARKHDASGYRGRTSSPASSTGQNAAASASSTSPRTS
jgi:CHAD domain-containing protein